MIVLGTGETEFSILTDSTHCQVAPETGASLIPQLVCPHLLGFLVICCRRKITPLPVPEQEQLNGGLLMERAASWSFSGHVSGRATLQPGQVETGSESGGAGRRWFLLLLVLLEL